MTQQGQICKTSPTVRLIIQYYLKICECGGGCTTISWNKGLEIHVLQNYLVLAVCFISIGMPHLPDTLSPTEIIVSVGELRIVQVLLCLVTEIPSTLETVWSGAKVQYLEVGQGHHRGLQRVRSSGCEGALGVWQACLRGVGAAATGPGGGGALWYQEL